MAQQNLFPVEGGIFARGYAYEADFLSPAEESARMRFRRYPPQAREKSIAIELAPRSIYRLQDEARWDWQHCVPPTPGLRYSITFRTLRGARAHE